MEFRIGQVTRAMTCDVLYAVADEGIVRHRGKIEATINNARRARELIEAEGSLAAYVWRFEADPPAVLEVVSTSPASVALSKDLKKRGWAFVGPTTVYAFMQAMGLVNDHIEGCHVRQAALDARSRFKVPQPG